MRISNTAPVILLFLVIQEAAKGDTQIPCNSSNLPLPPDIERLDLRTALNRPALKITLKTPTEYKCALNLQDYELQYRTDSDAQHWKSETTRLKTTLLIYLRSTAYEVRARIRCGNCHGNWSTPKYITIQNNILRPKSFKSNITIQDLVLLSNTNFSNQSANITATWTKPNQQVPIKYIINIRRYSENSFNSTQDLGNYQFSSPRTVVTYHFPRVFKLGVTYQVTVNGSKPVNITTLNIPSPTLNTKFQLIGSCDQINVSWSKPAFTGPGDLPVSYKVHHHGMTNHTNETSIILDIPNLNTTMRENIIIVSVVQETTNSRAGGNVTLFNVPKGEDLLNISMSRLNELRVTLNVTSLESNFLTCGVNQGSDSLVATTNVNTSLLFSNLTAGHEYNITCNIQNSIAMCNRTVFGRLPNVPGPPQNLSVSLHGSCSEIGLMWSEPHDKGSVTDGPTSKYRLTIMESNTTNWNMTETKAMNSFNVTNLTANTEYLIVLEAGNNLGFGENITKNITTLSEAPEISNFIVNMSLGEVAVHLKQPAHSTDLTFVCIAEPFHSNDNQTEAESNTTEPIVVLKNLTPDTDYKVTCFSMRNGSRSCDNSSNSTRIPNVPGPPQKVVSNNETSCNSIFVSWSEPEGTRLLLVEYGLHVMKKNKTDQEIVVNKTFKANEFNTTITNLTANTEYFVTIIAFNNLGNSRNVTIHLITLPEAPKISNFIVNKSLGEVAVHLKQPAHSTDLTFVCIADHEPFHSNDNQTEAESNTTEPIVVLKNLTPDTDYKVTCFSMRNGSRSCDNSSNSTRVPNVPGPPQNLSVSLHGSCSEIGLMWSEPHDNGSVIDGLTVKYRLTIMESNTTNWNMTETKAMNSFNVTNLTANTEYLIVLEAGNNLGFGGNITKNITTLSEAPKILNVSNSTLGIVTVYLTRPTASTDLMYTCIAESHLTNETASSNNTAPKIELNNLQPGANYNLTCFSMRNGYISCGNTTKIILVPNTPGKVENVTIVTTNYSFENFTVTWTKPQSSLPILNYEVTYNYSSLHTGLLSKDINKNTTTNTTTITLTNLIPGTTYNVYVRAYSDVGPGEYSNVTTANTSSYAMCPEVFILKPTRAGKTRSVKCSAISQHFYDAGIISARCGDNGVWGILEMSQCTFRESGSYAILVPSEPSLNLSICNEDILVESDGFSFISCNTSLEELQAHYHKLNIRRSIVLMKAKSSCNCCNSSLDLSLPEPFNRTLDVCIGKVGATTACNFTKEGTNNACNNRFTALNESKCICTVDEDSDGKPDLERTQDVCEGCCFEERIGNITWAETTQSLTASVSCSQIHNVFSDARATRKCNSKGDWEEVDLSKCTFENGTKEDEVIVFLMEVISYSTAETILNQTFMKYNFSLNLTFEIINLTSSAVLVIIKSTTLITINETSVFVESLNFTAESSNMIFKPNRSECSCEETHSRNITGLCVSSGPACECIHGKICNCTAPFVRNKNNKCEIYKQSMCISNETCMLNASIASNINRTCKMENNTFLNETNLMLTWPQTLVGQTAHVLCPPSNNITTRYFATRRCGNDSQWDSFINYTLCETNPFLEVVDKINALQEGLLESNDSDKPLTSSVRNLIRNITAELKNATEILKNQSQLIFPSDIQNAISVLVEISKLGAQNELFDESNSNTILTLQNIFEIIDHILSDTNKPSFKEINKQTQEIGLNDSVSLLRATERFVRHALNKGNTDVNSVSENLIIEGITVNLDTSNNSEVLYFVKFPKKAYQNFSSQKFIPRVKIPLAFLQEIINSTGAHKGGVDIAHVVLHNMEEYLPLQFADTPNITKGSDEIISIASLIVSIQVIGINDTSIQASNASIEIEFLIKEEVAKIKVPAGKRREYICVYWDYEANKGIGGWSTNNVWLARNTFNKTTLLRHVLCESSHLTFFAVLLRFVDNDCKDCCSVDFDTVNNITWTETPNGEVASIKCSLIYESFSDAMATRKCNNTGNWESVNIDRCTFKEEIEEDSILIVSANLKERESFSNATEELKNLLPGQLNLSNDSLYEVDIIYINDTNFQVIIAIRLINVTGNSSSLNLDHISNNTKLNLINGVSLHVPKGFCPCRPSSALEGNSLRMGILAHCISSKAITTTQNEECECLEPFIKTDTNRCDKDTDQDTVPDSQDDCPTLRGAANQTGMSKGCPLNISNYISSEICSIETDVQWGLPWPTHKTGELATLACSLVVGNESLLELVGIAKRKCLPGGIWDEVDTSECESAAIREAAIKITDILKNVSESLSENQRKDIVEVLVQLNEATQPRNGSIFSKDLNTTVDVLSNIADLGEKFELFSVGSNSTLGTLNGTASIISNILSIQNKAAFSSTESIGILSATERIAQSLENITTERMLNFSNTVWQVILDSVKSSGKERREIPTQNTDQIEYATNLTIPEATRNILEGPVVIVRMRNIELYLSCSLTELGSSGKQFCPGSTLISGQIAGMPNASVPENSTDKFLVEFKLKDEVKSIDIPRGKEREYTCVFWDFDTNNGTGGWSRNGVNIRNFTEDESGFKVTCASSHLTSFVVLVSVVDKPRFNIAFNVLTYIGCSISLVCLIISILFFVSLRKELIQKVHNYVHLNLCIALTIGLTIFLAGIDSATTNPDACRFVAFLLHYFFLTLFTWSLCEGVLIYNLLVKVFGANEKKWIYVYTALGWGLPLPIVLISVASRSEFYLRRQSWDPESIHFDEVHACWLPPYLGVIWAFVVPMILILVVNAVLLSISMISVSRNQCKKHFEVSKKKEPTKIFKTGKQLLKTTIILLPLFCFTWVIGLFAVGPGTEVLVVLFILSNTLQGLLIFLLHVVRHEKVWSRIKKHFTTLKEKSLLTSTTGTRGRSMSVMSKTSHGIKSSNIYASIGKATSSVGGAEALNVADDNAKQGENLDEHIYTKVVKPKRKPLPERADSTFKIEENVNKNESQPQTGVMVEDIPLVQPKEDKAD